MEKIWNKFGKIQLETWNCEKGERYLDPVRNIFTVITPEEEVRQKMLHFLMNELFVPSESISVEDHLTHYGVKDKNGRIDICIKRNGAPLAVIECKRPEVSIEGFQVYQQAKRYAAALGAPYIILVNGEYIQYYHFNNNTGKYCETEGILTYQQMADDYCKKQQKRKQYKRISLQKYQDITYLKQTKMNLWNEIIGEDTNEELAPAIFNLTDCFFDCTHKIKKLESKRFKLIEDLGLKWQNYNDRSGGGFGTGEYRVLLINDGQTKKQFLAGFSMSVNGKTTNHPKWKTRYGSSVLTICRNDGENDEMSAQIKLAKYLKIKEMKAELYHNGAFGQRNPSPTINGFKGYIQEKGYHILRKDKKFFLGELDISESLYMDSPDVEKLLSNLIEYAFYRDEYRHSLKK